MYSTLNSVQLKNGDSVEAGVVIAPDETWRERIGALLLHKGDLWRWQIAQMSTRALPIESYHYLLHRDGTPISHILTAEHRGVGILGHVWTQPAERGQGAASSLMGLQMEHFRARGGQALYLNTGYDSPAYHIYRKHGFAGVEAQSGLMAWFATSQDEFEAQYFAPGETTIEPLDWPHWASGSALLSGDFPGVIRNLPLQLLGRSLSEEPLLVPLHERYSGETPAPSRAFVLQKSANGAVVGLAAWGRDALWPDVCVVDVYCHPDFWGRAAELLAHLPLPDDCRVVAYVETNFETKRQLLESAGFHAVATLPRWIDSDAAQSDRLDVIVMERR